MLTHIKTTRNVNCRTEKPEGMANLFRKRQHVQDENIFYPYEKYIKVKK